jgi:hypothetical protein
VFWIIFKYSIICLFNYSSHSSDSVFAISYYSRFSCHRHDESWRSIGHLTSKSSNLYLSSSRIEEIKYDVNWILMALKVSDNLVKSGITTVTCNYHRRKRHKSCPEYTFQEETTDTDISLLYLPMVNYHIRKIWHRGAFMCESFDCNKWILT